MSIKALLNEIKSQCTEEVDWDEDAFVTCSDYKKDHYVMKITETAKYSLKPDKICVIMIMRNAIPGEDYAEADWIAERHTEILLRLLTRLGIEKEQVVGKGLDISHAIRKTKDDKEELGYTYRQVIEVMLPMDMQLLSQLIHAVKQSELTVNVEFEYRVSDMDGAREKAVREAARRNKQKAEMIAEELGVVLKGIGQVLYNGKDCDISGIESERRLYPRRLEEMDWRFDDRTTTVNPLIDEPNDIVVCEEIIVEWFLKDVKECLDELNKNVS